MLHIAVYTAGAGWPRLVVIQGDTVEIINYLPDGECALSGRYEAAHSQTKDKYIDAGWKCLFEANSWPFFYEALSDYEVLSAIGHL